MMCQRIGRPPMGIIGLGMSSATSRMRVPCPPHRMTTCIDLPPSIERTGPIASAGKRIKSQGEIPACDGATQIEYGSEASPRAGDKLLQRLALNVHFTDSAELMPLGTRRTLWRGMDDAAYMPHASCRD